MPFDPAKPVENTALDAAEMRSQFNGLHAIIQAVPAGPQGAQGPPFAQAVVDGVSTLNPGDPATVQVSFDGTNVHFTFAIPRGNDGTNGSDGTGVSSAAVDSVSTVDPGQPATVSVNFDAGSSTLHFSFGIPRGNDGGQGGQGEQGPPGEVTASQLSSAISGTSNNSNGVGTMDTPFANDPPTLADLEVMRAKMNELIVALRR